MSYKASTDEKKIEIVNLASLEDMVRQRMEKGAFGYVVGGAEDEWTLKQNTLAFSHKQISPRVLQGISFADLSTEIFGIPLKTPVIQCPCAAQGLMHEKGEVATAIGVAAAGSLFCISTYASTSIHDAAKAVDAPQLFQLYMSKDDGFNKYMINEAVRAGSKAIILTVDSTLGGYREQDIVNNFQFPLPMANLVAYSERNNASGSGQGKGISEIYAAAKQDFTPADIPRVKSMSHLPVIVKGIQSPLDAELAISAGADGIWVSNHGGRQLDGGPASFDVLAAIADVVAKRVPVIFDSGVRRGEHVFKAIASGADLVGIGRPILYGLNLGGAQGVTSVLEHINHELSITMQLAGTKTIEAIKMTQLLSRNASTDD